MKKKLSLLVFLATIVALISGCGFSGFSGIRGETIIYPLSSILSRPYTAEEVPNFYKRRYLNNLPHRNNQSQTERRDKREWGSKTEIRLENWGRRR